ncbi:MAG: hypothetical protein AAB790_02790 [Patescibacteria group bacterium]
MLDKILHDAGIKLPAVSIPHVTVPDWAWILLVGVLIGAIAWRAIHHHFRARFVRTHLRHLLKSGVITEIHFDADTNQVFVVDSSGETLVPAKPYKGDAVPAKHFEGITDLEIISGALKLKKLAYVVRSTWSTKDNGPEHWRVKPLPASAVMTDAPQPPKRAREDRSKAVTAAPPSVSNRDQRPEQPASEAVH